MASDRPISDMVSRLNPSAQTAMKLASTEMGSATPVMTVERHEFRKRNTTSTVSRAPSSRASSTVDTEFFTRVPASFTMSIVVPAGSVGRISSRRPMTFAATSVVL